MAVLDLLQRFLNYREREDNYDIIHNRSELGIVRKEFTIMMQLL